MKLRLGICVVLSIFLISLPKTTKLTSLEGRGYFVANYINVELNCLYHHDVRNCLRCIVNSNTNLSYAPCTLTLVKISLKIMFTDLDVDDRWVLGQDNSYGFETLIINIYAPIMNDLDFSLLTSWRWKDLGLCYIHC